MKVRELIELLGQKDPEKEVMIQQGEEYDYAPAYSVRDTELVNIMSDDGEEIEVVVIDFIT